MKTITDTKKVKDIEEGNHVIITFSDNTKLRLQKLTSGESMGLPGWHNMDAKNGSSYLGDTQDEAIKFYIKDSEEIKRKRFFV